MADRHDDGRRAGASPQVAWRRTRAAALLSAAGLALAACATDEPAPTNFGEPPRAFQQAPAYDNSDRPITQLLRTRPAVDREKRAELLDSRTFSASPQPLRSRTELAMTGAPGAGGGELRRLTLAFNQAPARDVVRTIVQEHLGRDLVIDPDLTGTVTMDVDDEMTSADVLDLLNTLASLYGWIVEDRADALVVRPLDGATLRSPDVPIVLARTLAEGAEPAIRIRRMRHLDPAQLVGGGARGAGASILASIMSPAAIVGSSGRLLVMVDTTAQLNKAAALLSVIDVPAFDGVVMETFRLAHKQPAQAADVLETIAQGARFTTANQQNDPPLRFIPVVGSDRLIVVAQDASLMTYARTWVEQFDTPDASERRYRFLYNIQHAEPRDLQDFVTAAFAGRIEQDRNVADTDKMQLTWGGARSGSLGASAPAGGGDASATRGVAMASSLASGKVLIHATYDDYVDLMEVMRALDRPPQQAVLQTVIAEVALTDSLEFGVEYFLQAISEDGFGAIELAATPGLVADSGTGSAFFVGGSGLALVQALQSETTLNIIQQPTVTLVDGGQAMFQVGGETPIQTAEQDTDTAVDGDTTIRREIEYRDTGIVLYLQAGIAESGDVRLGINLENRIVGPATDLGPEFVTRILRTEVVVPHGQTLVLAGFIDDTRNRSKSKTPLLGDVPGVGLAFSNLDNSDVRRELFLTITPEIINNPKTASRTVSSFLDAAERMRLVLASEAGSLPVAMLRDPDLDQPGPAVNLVLPPRPVEPAADATRDAQPAPTPRVEPTPDPRPAEPQPAPDAEPDPLEGLPEDTPSIIRELLRSGAGDRSAANPQPADETTPPNATTTTRTTTADATPPTATTAAPSASNESVVGAATPVAAAASPLPRPQPPVEPLASWWTLGAQPQHAVTIHAAFLDASSPGFAWTGAALRHAITPSETPHAGNVAEPSDADTAADESAQLKRATDAGERVTATRPFFTPADLFAVADLASIDPTAGCEIDPPGIVHAR